MLGLPSVARKGTRTAWAAGQFHVRPVPTSRIRWSSAAAAVVSEPSLRPEVQISPSQLSVAWQDGRRTVFDHDFLYDHCRCPKCFHGQTKQRLKTLAQVPGDIAPEAVLNDQAGLRIRWAGGEGHESFFPYTFLERAAYDPPVVPTSNVESTERVHWNSRIAQSPPTVEYNGIMPADAEQDSGNRAILDCLDKVHEFGFCFVSGVPATPEDTEALIRKIAPIRGTHYGGFWDFTSNMSHGDLAYSTEGLPAHTDTTYFTDPAGLQIFHLLSHPPPGQGGTSLLVDGFYAANLLRELHPTSYSTLSRLRIPAHASGTPGTMLRPVISQPVFRHDEHGELAQVRWNNEDRGVLGQGWTAGDVRAWYKAAKEYEALLRNQDTEYWVQLAPGTMVVIDNWRVMHGRSAFTGSRRMCGAYVGADDWRSRRTALRRELSGAGRDEWSVGW